MSKKEILERLANVPDDFVIAVCTIDCTGMNREPDVVSLEINNDTKTVYLQLEEEEIMF